MPDEVLKWTETHIEELGNALTEKPYEESEYIRKVLHYIKGNFSKDLSLEDAGKEIGISSFYLSRLLKQERKTTFIEILIRYPSGSSRSHDERRTASNEGNLLSKWISESVIFLQSSKENNRNDSWSSAQISVKNIWFNQIRQAAKRIADICLKVKKMIKVQDSDKSAR